MKLYATHVPLTAMQRAALAVGAAVVAAARPERADLVAAVGETTEFGALAAIRRRMLESDEGRAVLNHRPQVTDATLAHVDALPETSFGGAYARFMRRRGFAPHERPPVRFVDDAELAYVAQRYREVHDLWHVLFACPTTLLGELALKAVEYQQTGLPMCALAVAGGATGLGWRDRALLAAHYVPWAARASAVPTLPHLMSVYYERHWDEDLEALRARWGVIPCPRKRDFPFKQPA